MNGVWSKLWPECVHNFVDIRTYYEVLEEKRKNAQQMTLDAFIMAKLSTPSAPTTPRTSKQNTAIRQLFKTSVKPQPSTSETQPSTSEPQPSTSEPQPSTSEPQPSTSEPQPSTSEPQPSTSEPQPSTSEPQPSTSEPQPSTSEP
ncbi:protein FAM160A1-like 1 [Homarus americanus]|uniref:Protein FAM160A1-like 1 n=1 Tax=Homarus americanus TaxID=6706 RepID=A0A8J5K1D0_HOMAM|nr:protein FAM160A1-like 1 [Homarus americanus]